MRHINNRDWLIDTSFKEFAAGLSFILLFIIICIVSYEKICFSIIMMALATYCAMFAGKKLLNILGKIINFQIVIFTVVWGMQTTSFFEKKYEVVYEKIYSLHLKQYINGSGSFVLGCGSVGISTEDRYVFFVKNEDGNYSRKNVSALVDIKLSDEEEPKYCRQYEIIEYVPNDFLKMLGYEKRKEKKMGW